MSNNSLVSNSKINDITNPIITNIHNPTSPTKGDKVPTNVLPILPDKLPSITKD